MRVGCCEVPRSQRVIQSMDTPYPHLGRSFVEELSRTQWDRQYIICDNLITSYSRSQHCLHANRKMRTARSIRSSTRSRRYSRRRCIRIVAVLRSSSRAICLSLRASRSSRTMSASRGVSCSSQIAAAQCAGRNTVGQERTCWHMAEPVHCPMAVPEIKRASNQGRSANPRQGA